MEPTLSIIVPSSGERAPLLARCITEISRQMAPGDELLVSVDERWPWGYRARQEMMAKATGDALLFMDDDDVYTPEALQVIRGEVREHPDAIHVFRMDATNHDSVGHHYIWHTPELVAEGNVASQILCVPRKLWLGAWGHRYEGDCDFLRSTIERNPGVEVRWVDYVVCVLRPQVAGARA